MSFFCVVRTFKLTIRGEKMNICALILNDFLLIIPLKMCCIPYSRYRGPIKLV